MNFEETLKIVTAMVGVAGLWFGLLQYRSAQTWKRLEFAASVLNKINSDPDLRLAITFLDWRQRDFVLPERYLSLASKMRTFRHDHKQMAEAFDLRNREFLTETGDLDLKLSELTLERILYVDVFDRLFEYLEQVHAFINMGLIKLEDVVLVNYWANRVYEIQVSDRYIFREYLAHYKYKGVLALVNQHVRPSALFRSSE